MSIFSTDETFDEELFSEMILINLQKHLTKYLKNPMTIKQKIGKCRFQENF